jgi:hypothetical protein
LPAEYLWHSGAEPLLRKSAPHERELANYQARVGKNAPRPVAGTGHPPVKLTNNEAGAFALGACPSVP